MLILTIVKPKESLRFNFITTSDGVTGCYEDLIAECKLDFAQIGPDWKVDCVLPPRVNVSDKDLCYEGFVNTFLTTITPAPSVSIIVDRFQTQMSLVLWTMNFLVVAARSMIS